MDLFFDQSGTAWDVESLIDENNCANQNGVDPLLIMNMIDTIVDCPVVVDLDPHVEEEDEEVDFPSNRNHLITPAVCCSDRKLMLSVHNLLSKFTIVVN